MNTDHSPEQVLSAHLLKSDIAETEEMKIHSTTNAAWMRSVGIIPKAAMFLSRSQYTSKDSLDAIAPPLN